jgi:arginyl-tRNA synthetase
MGSQINTFGHSLYARYQQCLGREANLPLNGYFGNYMIDLAREITQEQGDKFLSLPQEEAISELTKIGLAKVIQKIREDLKLLNVEFDNWFSEKSLYQFAASPQKGKGKDKFVTKLQKPMGEDSKTDKFAAEPQMNSSFFYGKTIFAGTAGKAVALLQKGGYVAKKENAIWFESSALGEDKDNVLVRSDGTPTYFASDIAYHYNKFLERKFDTVIDIWGADHLGHVLRMKAVMKALGLTSLVCGK